MADQIAETIPQAFNPNKPPELLPPDDPEIESTARDGITDPLAHVETAAGGLHEFPRVAAELHRISALTNVQLVAEENARRHGLGEQGPHEPDQDRLLNTEVRDAVGTVIIRRPEQVARTRTSWDRLHHEDQGRVSTESQDVVLTQIPGETRENAASSSSSEDMVLNQHPVDVETATPVKEAPAADDIYSKLQSGEYGKWKAVNNKARQVIGNMVIKVGWKAKHSDGKNEQIAAAKVEDPVLVAMGDEIEKKIEAEEKTQNTIPTIGDAVAQQVLDISPDRSRSEIDVPPPPAESSDLANLQEQLNEMQLRASSSVEMNLTEAPKTTDTSDSLSNTDGEEAQGAGEQSAASDLREQTDASLGSTVTGSSAIEQPAEPREPDSAPKAIGKPNRSIFGMIAGAVLGVGGKNEQSN